MSSKERKKKSSSSVTGQFWIDLVKQQKKWELAKYFRKYWNSDKR
jgi:hypothetical protein